MESSSLPDNKQDDGLCIGPRLQRNLSHKIHAISQQMDQGRSVESFRKAASFARISKCIPVMRNLSKGNLDGVSPPLHSSFEIRRFNGRELSSRFFETWKRQGHRKFLSNYATYFFADLTNTLVWSGTRIALSNKIPVVMRNTLIRVSVSLTFMTNRLFAWQTNFPVRRTFLPETV